MEWTTGLDYWSGRGNIFKHALFKHKHVRRLSMHNPAYFGTV